jgi:hypothetical protein
VRRTAGRARSGRRGAASGRSSRGAFGRRLGGCSCRAGVMRCCLRGGRSNQRDALRFSTGCSRRVGKTVHAGRMPGGRAAGIPGIGEKRRRKSRFVAEALRDAHFSSEVRPSRIAYFVRSATL